MCFRDRDQKGELTFSELKLVIDKLPSTIKQVNLIGGEVFLRKDIFEILNYLNNKGYKIRIHTNGTLIDDEKIKKLSKIENLNGIGFSIDGTRELHDKIRGCEGAFDKTIDAIKKASKAFPVSVNTVLLDENFGQIEEIFKIIMNLGVREYRIEPEMFCEPREIEASGNLRIAANIKREGKYGYSADDLKNLKKRLDLAAKGKEIKVVIAPRVAEIDTEEFISGEIRDKRSLFCKHLLVPRIDSEGNLIFCHIIKEQFGNLLENDLEELWLNSEINEFRRSLLSNNLLPVCKRCCRLRSI
jgi:MoaA/NifB/PqqE/SkfB family radical SAM enzyme